MHVSIATIGQNRGSRRVWLEGQMLARAGFEPRTRYQVTVAGNAIVLEKLANGFRMVSARKRNEREIPIIDLNSNELLSLFEGMTQVRVTFDNGAIRIESLATEQRAKERKDRLAARLASGQPLQIGSLAHGGGVMDHATHAGLADAGIPCELAFANEIRADLMEQSMTVNNVWTDKTIALNMPMQELAFDQATLSKLPQVDILLAGLPCSGASVAGRAKRGLAHPEAHPLVGHLVVAFIALIARLNPAVIELEQVVPYASSASVDIIRTSLRDLGYDVQEEILDAADWNALEHRKRVVLIGTTKGLSVELAKLERPAKRTRQLAEILEPVALDADCWSKMEGLKDKEKRDAELGRSFAMQIFDESSEKVCTLTKGLAKNRSTDCKIRHPLNPDLLRIPTPVEHARAKDVPEHLIDGLSTTIAHELLGQSVNYLKFRATGALIGRSLKAAPAQKVEIDPFADLPLFALAH